MRHVIVSLPLRRLHRRYGLGADGALSTAMRSVTGNGQLSARGGNGKWNGMEYGRFMQSNGRENETDCTWWQEERRFACG